MTTLLESLMNDFDAIIVFRKKNREKTTTTNEYYYSEASSRKIRVVVDHKDENHGHFMIYMRQYELLHLPLSFHLSLSLVHKRLTQFIGAVHKCDTLARRQSKAFSI